MPGQHAQVLSRELPLLVVLFLLTAQFVPASSVLGLGDNAPEAVVDITRRDLGEVFAGEELEYAFIVRNAGTKPLELAEKTTTSSRLETSGATPSIAMWRPAERIFSRPVAARRAAPS